MHRISWILFVLYLGSLLISCGSPKEEVITGPDLIPKAQEFVDLLANKNYTGVHNRFDNTMKNAMPESKIKEVWEQQIQTKFGIFKKKIGARQTTEGGYNVVYVTCEFEKRKLNIKVVFNNQEQVSGLWFK